MIEFATNPHGWLARQNAAKRRINNKSSEAQLEIREKRREHLAGQKTGTDFIREYEQQESKSDKSKKVKDLTRDELIAILVIANVDFSVELSDQTLRRKLRRHLDAPA